MYNLQGTIYNLAARAFLDTDFTDFTIFLTADDADKDGLTRIIIMYKLQGTIFFMYNLQGTRYNLKHSAAKLYLVNGKLYMKWLLSHFRFIKSAIPIFPHGHTSLFAQGVVYLGSRALITYVKLL